VQYSYDSRLCRCVCACKKKRTNGTKGSAVPFVHQYCMPTARVNVMTTRSSEIIFALLSKFTFYANCGTISKECEVFVGKMFRLRGTVYRYQPGTVVGGSNSHARLWLPPTPPGFAWTDHSQGKQECFVLFCFAVVAIRDKSKLHYVPNTTREYQA
jgi:hypothetical protein